MVSPEPESARRAHDPKYYLDYLDKEMTIMGILSAFCLAIVAVSVERIVSIDKGSVVYNLATKVWSAGSVYLLTSSILVLIAAALFYKQRSLLAWFYGQVALESTLPDYTERNLKDWLKDADSWETWIPYTCAYWVLIAAIIEFILAVSAATCDWLQRFQVISAGGVIVLMLSWLFWIRRNSTKFKHEETLPYFRIH
jgi:hypothetical protein